MFNHIRIDLNSGMKARLIIFTIKVQNVMKLKSIGEGGVLETVKPFCGLNPETIIGFGDDGAVLKSGSGNEKWVFTSDMLMEETHFRLEFTDAFTLGAKSYEVNASDAAAMGARPFAAFLSIGAPADTEASFLREFYRGFAERSSRHQCVIAGGDTVRSPQLVISVSLIGKLSSNARPLLRSRAVPGQKIFVTGFPGESGAGLRILEKKREEMFDAEDKKLVSRHLLPEARVNEGMVLAEREETGAAIDISDGVASELNHISRNSGVKMVVQCNNLPVSPEIHSKADDLGEIPETFILFGGEDYELLFTSFSDTETINKHFQSAGSQIKCCEIGTVEKGEGLVFLDENGPRREIAGKGFSHF